jgi:hypothetical protein
MRDLLQTDFGHEFLTLESLNQGFDPSMNLFEIGVFCRAQPFKQHHFSG